MIIQRILKTFTQLEYLQIPYFSELPFHWRDKLYKRCLSQRIVNSRLHIQENKNCSDINVSNEEKPMKGEVGLELGLENG